MQLIQRNLHSLICIIFLTFLVTSIQAEDSLNFKVVADHADKTKYTSSEIKGFARDAKGKKITVEGKILDVKTGRSGKKVSLLTRAGHTEKFKVDVMVEDISGLRKGNHVTCTGKFHRYGSNLRGMVMVDGKCK